MRNFIIGVLGSIFLWFAMVGIPSFFKYVSQNIKKQKQNHSSQEIEITDKKKHSLNVSLFNWNQEFSNCFFILNTPNKLIGYILIIYQSIVLEWLAYNHDYTFWGVMDHLLSNVFDHPIDCEYQFKLDAISFFYFITDFNEYAILIPLGIIGVINILYLFSRNKTGNK